MTVTIFEGDNLDVLRPYPDASFTLVYLDPPFNTGRTREKAIETTRSIPQDLTDESLGLDPADRARRLLEATQRVLVTDPATTVLGQE